MTRLWNDPEAFTTESAIGFVRANARWVRAVPGGVSRSTRSPCAEVAVVIGGGTGHYPAFAGLVGPGLAHGAAMGNLFSSPSSHQVESVARASEQGKGVLLSYGNYAGDVLHFTAAQEALRADGIDCRTVTVTDDIFSAAPGEKHKRRGIAGDLTVFKIAGAAAASGYDINDVERVAMLTNDRTRTMGVAFTGCTLPGADKPLFSVPEGRMAIGLGIHGEAGIDETDIPSANGLAELFVEHLLAEAEIPEGVTPHGARVLPILNGLGSVKYEELFVVFARLAELLEAAGLTLVDPQVGEFCTSFDMAGASLTLVWLNDELEYLWTAPADTPTFRTGAIDTGSLKTIEAAEQADAIDVPIPAASDDSRRAAICAVEALRAVRDVIAENADELGRLDAIAGDGDHGIGMKRGSSAACESASSALSRQAGLQTVLTSAADAWSDQAGGTSGALWGMILRTLGNTLGDTQSVSPTLIATGVSAAQQAVMDYGKAAVGDKTMVDALVPFAETLADGAVTGLSLAVAWKAAADSAAIAAEHTKDLLPGMGRARAHGDKALGAADPGAVSFALIVERVYHVLAKSGTRQNTASTADAVIEQKEDEK